MEFIILAVIIYFIIKALGNSDSSSSNQDLSTKHDGISPVQPDRKPSVIPDSFFNSYQNLLKEYYRKYKDQVFQKRILSEIQQKISFERDMSEIKHDIKMIRQELNFSPEKLIRILIIFSNVVKCRYSLYLRAFPTFSFRKIHCISWHIHV